MLRSAPSIGYALAHGWSVMVRPAYGIRSGCVCQRRPRAGIRSFRAPAAARGALCGRRRGWLPVALSRPTSARTCSACHVAPAPARTLRAAARLTSLAGAGATRLFGRRFVGWGRADLAIDSMGSRATHRPLVAPSPLYVNGGGCAAASISGDRWGDASRGNRRTRRPRGSRLPAQATTPPPPSTRGGTLDGNPPVRSACWWCPAWRLAARTLAFRGGRCGAP